MRLKVIIRTLRFPRGTSPLLDESEEEDDKASRDHQALVENPKIPTSE
jgi:hypothetical protein